MIDVVIIGAGPGGFDTAIYAKEHGLEVTLIEKERVGGTCLNWGCIPTKALYHHAKKIKDMAELDVFGVSVPSFTINQEVIKTRKETIVDNQIKNIHTSLEKLGVNLIQGTARIVSPNTVEVNGTLLKTKHIIIATGSQPKRLSFEGDDLPIVHDSKGLLSLDLFPKRMLVVGAGVIGSEMASIFTAFDCEVTLVEYLDDVLPSQDKDIKKRAKSLFKRKGINIKTSTALTKLEQRDKEYVATLQGKRKTEEVVTDYVLLSTGRSPYFGGLDLDQLQIKYDGQGITVNEHKQTSVASIYAIGDVNGEMMLAHKATYDGYKAINHILGKEFNVDFNLVPSVVFSFPEIASVGVTEDMMTGDYQTNKFLYKTNAKAECMNETDGFIKLIIDHNRTLVGCHIIGTHASDLIHEATLAIHQKMTIDEYQTMIHAHPTISEVLGECIKGF